MFRVIRVLDAKGEPAEMPLMSNGNTARRYKQVWGRDLFRDSDLFGSPEASVEERIQAMERLAFIMHCQAAGQDMRKMNGQAQQLLEEWMETLDSSVIVRHFQEIYDVYLSTKETASKLKN